jgi:hypothetical protein
MSTVQSNNLKTQTSTVFSIFSNNFMVAAVTLIPGVGWGYILMVMWNTGVVVASYNQPAYWVLNNPFAWIELSVYSFAVLWSIKLFYMVKDRKRPQYGQRLFAYAVLGLMVVGVVLFLSAVLEFSIIHTVLR